MPIVILLAIGGAVAVAVIVGNQRDDDNENSSSNNLSDLSFKYHDLRPAPHLADLQCPPGVVGPVTTNGSLGRVQCNYNGEVEGDVIPCPSGTLYDVNMNVCNRDDYQVVCSTKVMEPVSDTSNSHLPETLRHSNDIRKIILDYSTLPII